MPKNKFKVGDRVCRVVSFEGKIDEEREMIARLMGFWDELIEGFEATVVALPGMKLYDEKNFTVPEKGFLLKKDDGKLTWLHQNGFELKAKKKTLHGKTTKKGKGSKAR